MAEKIRLKKLYIAEKPSLGKAIVEALVELSKRPGNEKGDAVVQVRGSTGVTHIIVGGEIGVSWFYGHMLALVYPEAYNPALAGGFKKTAHLLPVIPDVWKIEPIKKSLDQLNVVKGLCSNADIIVNAGDPDAEGMLLVMEALEYFGVTVPILRLLPNAMDSHTIKKAIAEESDNNNFITMYHRALGRSRADWLVGMNMSRACTAANSMGDMLSVGRVQTPTLSLVVKRDLEIENFVPENYFMPTPEFVHSNGKYRGKWMCPQGQPGVDKEGRLVDGDIAKSLVDAVTGKTGTVNEYSVTDSSERQPLPFSLATIQSKANTAFGFTAKKVLQLCQSLYETHKVASYPRTDSGYLKESQFADADRILSAISKFDPAIEKLVQGADTKIKSPAWNDKHVIAHHGIIPTAAPNYQSLSPDERKIFSLIAKNYIAQFYPEFTFKKTSVVTECAGHKFKSNGRTPIDLGWKKIFGADEEELGGAKRKEGEEDQILPLMEKGDPAKCSKIDLGKKTTKAPNRYSEASLLYAMTHISETVDDPVLKKKLVQSKGIGTPATQAAIIERLKEVGFIDAKGKQLISSLGAREFIQGLPVELTDAALTAQWETSLDGVQEGRITLDRFMTGIVSWVSDLTKKTLATKISISLDKKAPATELKEAGAGGACGACGKGTMTPRKASKGPNAGKYFLGCSCYPECKHTQNVVDKSEGSASSTGSKSSTGTSRTVKRKGFSTFVAPIGVNRE